MSAKARGDTLGFEWDVEGELTATGGASFVYDADGNRLTRTDTTGTTVYLGGQEVRIASSEVTATRYYAFAGQTVAMRTGRGLGNTVTSLVADHHGTPVAAVPNGGHPATTPVKRLYTDPYGATRGTSTVATIPGDTQFLGKTRDESTGLTLLGARYYDEAVGSFISVDPILDLTDPQQWNGYAYAGNNPVTFSDASGLLAIGATDDVDVRGKSFTSKANGTVRASRLKAVEPPVRPSVVGAIDPVNSPGDANSPEPRGLPSGAIYSYVIDDWLGVGLQAETPVSIMNIFKEHPQEIFPFGVEGCDRIIDGARRKLIEAVPTLPDGSGWVEVSTTSTSVLFTVGSNSYFDGLGSTIVESAEGLTLRREARATDANYFVAAGVAAGAVKVTWAAQAANLRRSVLHHAGGE